MSNAARTRRRNPRIEALRLLALLGIAVFHSFQATFDAATNGALALDGATLSALGCVSLLGTYGNHVFFLISGLFLVPRAAAAAREPGFWRTQARSTARRALPILMTVIFYAAAALAASAWAVPVPGVSLESVSWLVGGLQFVWVYLSVMLATPVVGWAWARVRRPARVVAALTAVTFAVNAYIAFVSPGDDVRELLEWRKLMSAATYLVAYLVGGALAEGTSRVWPARLLAGSAVASVCAECAAGLDGHLSLLAALSFKSTSALSFALAVSSVAVAARGGEPSDGRVARALSELTRSTLGFYVAQSVFYGLWNPAVNELVLGAAALGGAALLAVGAAASVALLAVVVAADQLLRIPLFRLLRLA